MREDTSTMTTREIADYLAKQQVKHWPGSKSIHPRVWLYGLPSRNALRKSAKSA